MEKVTKEKKSSKMDLLSAVEGIVGLAENSQFSPEFYKKASRYIKYLGTRLNLTQEQCVMLALFIDNSYYSNILCSDMMKYTGCRTTRIIRYMNDIDELVRRGFLVRSCSHNSRRYRVPLDVVDAFKSNEVFSPKSYSGLSCHELFGEFASIIDSVADDEMDYNTAVEHFKLLLDSNPQLLFVQKVCSRSLNKYDNELALLIMFCHLFVDDSDDYIGFHDLDDFFNKKILRSIKSELRNGDNILQEEGLIEYCDEEGMGNRERFRLTMNAKRELLDELNLPSLTENKACRNMVKTTDIKPRELFYSSEITHTIDDLASLLDESNYCDIRTRLQQQGFRCGFTCLFYGAPGTGKTETALQLARRTGRDIMQVNFAEIKSCWVGESEKNIKALFDTYRQRVKESKVVPILLFNEADAIIGKRREGAERAVDKMENSIQNIILQEMETLDGILIATTNLAQNLDRAFERRFLYKVRFDRPTVEARVAIWREMMPDLAPSDASRLAERYDFSGGQIENIARLYAIDAIIHGTAKPTYDQLAPHCDKERLDNTTKNRIGFSS